MKKKPPNEWSQKKKKEYFESLGETIYRLRKATKTSQGRLGEILSLHQTAICRVEAGQQSLDPLRICALTKYFQIDPSALLLGKINYWEVAQRFGVKRPLPVRYQEYQHSKVRELLPLIYFLNNTQGDAYTKKTLVELELDSILYSDADQSISVNANLDIVRTVLKNGALNEGNFKKLIDQTRHEFVHGFLHHVYETQRNSLNLIKAWVLNSHHYEANFEYGIEDCNKEKLDLSITPMEHMTEVGYRDAVLHDFLCRYKKQFFQSFPLYIDRKPMELVETECHFKSKANRCIYRLRAA